MARQARKTAAQVAAKWSQNLANSQQSIKDGVNGVQTSPTALAAANPQGYLQGVQNAVANGTWAAGLNRVSLQDWKNAMLNKGLGRVATGAAQAQPKVQAAMGPLLQFIYDTRDQINSANPRGSLQQNIQRSVAMQQAMAGYKRS